MTRRLLLAALAAVLLLPAAVGCGARYAIRFEGWGTQVELSVDTREVDERRVANGTGAPTAPGE